MGVYSKLLKVQNELKAPKGQYNTFGKYKYRNCEDILEAAKPLCVENGLLLSLTDKVEFLEGRFYVKATAKVIDIDDGSCHEVEALAREEESKKGMDGSQVTGASSSYARKYALNGLFCIDDTKDSDSTNTHGKEEKKEKEEVSKQDWKESLDIPPEWQGKVVEVEVISEAQAKRIFAIGKGNNELIKEIILKYGFTSSKSITKDKYNQICQEIENGGK